MKQQVTKRATVKTEQGGRDFHRVDTTGNYFINGKCQNPKADLEGNEIGYNIPKLEWEELPTNVAHNILETKYY